MKLKLLSEGHKAFYMDENKCTEDDYNTKMKNPETCPKDCPKMKKGLLKSEFVELSEIKN